MNPSRRTLVLTLATVALAGSPGCVLGWWQGGTTKQPASTAMSGPEAQLVLSRARKHLYADTKKGKKTAVRLADSVIRECAAPRYVWDAFLVKATAFSEAGEHAEAQQAAHEGVQAILAADPAPLDGDSLTAMKTLLPVYVECCAGTGAHKEAAAALDGWKKEILARYANAAEHRDHREAINLEFKLLQEMIEQSVASRQPESQVKSLVLAYVRLYNTDNLTTLAGLFGPENGRPPVVARVVASKKRPGSGTKRLYFASAVRVEVPTTSQEVSFLSAEAVCDMLAASSSGWARVVTGVRFSFVRDDDGRWLIKDVSGHP